MTLRELRLWHWTQWMDLRVRQNAYHPDTDSHKFYERLINPHIHAVQCLNDHVTGTAEQDAAQKGEG